MRFWAPTIAAPTSLGDEGFGGDGGGGLALACSILSTILYASAVDKPILEIRLTFFKQFEKGLDATGNGRLRGTHLMSKGSQSKGASPSSWGLSLS